MSFSNNQVRFLNEQPIVFFVPHIQIIYVNPSNHHLQSNYYHEPEPRTIEAFTDEILRQIKEKNIPEK